MELLLDHFGELSLPRTTVMQGVMDGCTWLWTLLVFWTDCPWQLCRWVCQIEYYSKRCTLPEHNFGKRTHEALSFFNYMLPSGVLLSVWATIRDCRWHPKFVILLGLLRFDICAISIFWFVLMWHKWLCKCYKLQNQSNPRRGLEGAIATSRAFLTLVWAWKLSLLVPNCELHSYTESESYVQVLFLF